MSYTVGMVSLGCPKNQVDGEMLLSSLQNAGFTLCTDVQEADAVLVNTCGFIESAKKESIEEILKLARLKQQGRLRALVVTGCLAERYREQIQQEMPEVDVTVGIGANGQIADLLANALQSHSKVEAFPEKDALPLSGGRILSTPPHTAYLKIAEGCDNRCSYCAIPLIRGRFRSRPIDDVVQEAEALAQSGVKELIVVAQDTTRYGEDLYGRLELPALLRRLCRIPQVRWIRLLYCYPNRITEELLDCMAEEEKILRYMDLPLQHCSRRILRAMHRPGDPQSLLALVRHMREKLPGLVLRTTFIAGFPGETEEDFEELAGFVRDAAFDRLGCFAYSQEEDTPAAELPDQVEEDKKQRRAEQIMEIQMEIMEKLGQARVGQTLDVLVEGYDEDAEQWFGRSYADAPEIDGLVLFSADTPPQVGEIVPVAITGAAGCDLFGVQAGEGGQ